MSAEDYARMAHAQDGGCAICGSRPPMLSVDHCHSSGQVRALLCAGCNTGLGLFGDVPSRLRAAADYVEAHRG